jgi:hypothetical protein
VSEPFIRSLVVAGGDPAEYPFSIPAIASLSELELDPHVTFLARPERGRQVDADRGDRGRGRPQPRGWQSQLLVPDAGLALAAR